MYLMYQEYILSWNAFDAHLQEILGAVSLGETCILLDPDGGTNLNIPYLMDVVQRHQVTFINLVKQTSSSYFRLL